MARSDGIVGTWGTGVFDDDVACDARDGFREAIGDGMSAQAASDLVIRHLAMDSHPGPGNGAAWLGLAVTQWKTGRLLDEVRETALAVLDAEIAQPLFDDEPDRVRRERVLERTRSQLLEPQGPPVKIRRQRVAQSPFLQGDVLLYTTHRGAQVAFWATHNSTHELLVTTSVDTYFRLVAIGDPHISDARGAVAGEPVVLTRDSGSRKLMQFSLRLPQDATGDQWELIGNVPFNGPKPTSFSMAPAVRATTRHRGGTFDARVESWISAARHSTPENDAAQQLIDLVPDLPGPRVAWTDLAWIKAEDVAMELVDDLVRRGDIGLGVLAACETMLNAGAGPRRVALTVLDSLLTASTHPETGLDREVITDAMGPRARDIMPAIDEAWLTIDPLTARPDELDDPSAVVGRDHPRSAQRLSRIRNRWVDESTVRLRWTRRAPDAKYSKLVLILSPVLEL